jgi:hypothetical protein
LIEVVRKELLFLCVQPDLRILAISSSSTAFLMPLEVRVIEDPDVDDQSDFWRIETGGSGGGSNQDKSFSYVEIETIRQVMEQT